MHFTIEAMSDSDRAKERCQSMPGPSVREIEEAAAEKLNDWLQDANRIEDAIDNLGDVKRWPEFCKLISQIVSTPDAYRLSASRALAKMLRSALEGEATEAAMAELGRPQ